MEVTAKKTEAFLSAIHTLAAEECKRIDEETESIREQRLKTMQSEAKKRYQTEMEYEIARIRADANREISQKGEESRRTLSDLRTSLCEQVFSRARAQIEAYTKTDAYREFLLRSAQKIGEMFRGGEVTLFISQADSDKADAICKSFGEACTVTVSSDILLGGIRAADRKSHQLADNTLDTALAEQKAWFLENSGLSVEE